MNKASETPRKPEAGKADTPEGTVEAETGCCTIEVPGGADSQIPDITKADCDRRARAAGGVGHWVKGACA